MIIKRLVDNAEQEFVLTEDEMMEAATEHERLVRTEQIMMLVKEFHNHGLIDDGGFSYLLRDIEYLVDTYILYLPDEDWTVSAQMAIDALLHPQHEGGLH